MTSERLIALQLKHNYTVKELFHSYSSIVIYKTENIFLKEFRKFLSTRLAKPFHNWCLSGHRSRSFSAVTFLRSTVQILAYHLLRASENMVLVIWSDLIIALFGNR